MGLGILQQVVGGAGILQLVVGVGWRLVVVVGGGEGGILQLVVGGLGPYSCSLLNMMEHYSNRRLHNIHPTVEPSGHFGTRGCLWY